ncbi:nucleotidyl transferase AbiEii/AbiGii toxin family protein [Candidatus Saganbacteria bacterium]|nr:nucleotidyl transferase AbiEii/AbiGii toxin family protein [Candidatus Saganbacteria bacterium]
MEIDTQIRDAQLKLLRSFAKTSKTFALAGGTALELFYLKHRFSRDLDFFSPKYGLKEIDEIIAEFSKTVGSRVKLENDFAAAGRARVRFYTVKIKGTAVPLKIDFVEDVLFSKPQIELFKKVPVYAVKEIYFQKVVALTGTRLLADEIGREAVAGRMEARDVFDIYYLSKNILPLHKFLRKLYKNYQRGMIQWFRSYSRQETKLGVLDLAIYDKHFDAAKMIDYLDKEIRSFMAEVV